MAYKILLTLLIASAILVGIYFIIQCISKGDNTRLSIIQTTATIALFFLAAYGLNEYRIKQAKDRPQVSLINLSVETNLTRNDIMIEVPPGIDVTKYIEDDRNAIEYWEGKLLATEQARKLGKAFTELLLERLLELKFKNTGPITAINCGIKWVILPQDYKEMLRKYIEKRDSIKLDDKNELLNKMELSKKLEEWNKYINATKVDYKEQLDDNTISEEKYTSELKKIDSWSIQTVSDNSQLIPQQEQTFIYPVRGKFMSRGERRFILSCISYDTWVDREEVQRAKDKKEARDKKYVSYALYRIWYPNAYSDIFVCSLIASEGI